jgi:hypothetical protein
MTAKKPKSKPKHRLFSRTQAARELGISPSSVHRLMTWGTMPGVKLRAIRGDDGRLYVDAEDLVAFLQALVDQPNWALRGEHLRRLAEDERRLLAQGEPRGLRCAADEEEPS